MSGYGLRTVPPPGPGPSMCAVSDPDSSDARAAVRAGRPLHLLLVWIVLLGAFAAVAPMAQTASGIPFDVLSLVMLAPAAAGAVVLVRPSWLPRTRRPVSAGAVWRTAGYAVIAVTAFGTVLAVATGRAPDPSALDAGIPVAAFIAVQAVGVLSEEFGWRGIVQQCGERFARPETVSVTAGFVFGATHIGYWPLGPVPVLTFSATAAVMGLTIALVFRGTMLQRMVPAVIVHLGVNLVLSVFSAPEEPLATAPVTLAAASAMLAAASLVEGVRRRGREGDRAASP